MHDNYDPINSPRANLKDFKLSLYSWVINDLNLLIYYFKSESCFAIRKLHLISTLSICIEFSFTIHFSNRHSTWYRFEFLSTFTPLFLSKVCSILFVMFFLLFVISFASPPPCKYQTVLTPATQSFGRLITVEKEPATAKRRGQIILLKEAVLSLL